MDTFRMLSHLVTISNPGMKRNPLIPSTIAFIILFSVFFSFGCTLVPSGDQFVSAGHRFSPARSNGSCSEEFFSNTISDKKVILEGLSPNYISMLNWNIYKGNSSGWRDDFASYSRSKDIILLQEAPLNEEMLNILNRSRLFWNFNSAFKYQGTEFGVMTASSTQPLGSCGTRQDEPLIGLPKTIIISSYAIANFPKKLLVANIHGINITLGTGAYREQIESLHNILQHHDGPIILAGDFNNWTAERKKIIDNLIGELSLTMLPFENENRTIIFGDPVDHILYRGLKPLSHYVHHVNSSDHNPITVAFRLYTAPSTNN